MGKAMQTYTKLLYTQGDWGVLATVNVKSYAALEALYQKCADAPLPIAAAAEAGFHAVESIPFGIPTSAPARFCIRRS